MKKGLKITLIVLGVLVGIVALDTLQAKIFDNSPLLKIREVYHGGDIYYIDKGLFVNHYRCNDDEKVTTWKGTKFACSIKEDDTNNNALLNCFKSKVEAYITSEKNVPKEEKLENLIAYEKNNVEYSYVRKSEIGIYVILKTTDDKIIQELDKYFEKEYEGYQTAINNDYKIYVYNNLNDFDLENDFATCYKD